MKCMTKELLGILSPAVREMVKRVDLDKTREIRLKVGCPVRIVGPRGAVELPHLVQKEDLTYLINAASRYSPWSCVGMGQGYLTAPGGHRIGICGEAVLDKGTVQTLRNPSSVCIRLARQLPEVGKGIALEDSLLILGPPGSGKTTLLRELIRRLSQEKRESVSVVDERGELFPQLAGQSCFDSAGADILTGAPKPEGIEMVLRSMGPSWIAVDEITAARDCQALVQAGWCGVRLLATVHASGVEDLRHRPVYRPLVESGIFSRGLVLSPAQHLEEVGL